MMRTLVAALLLATPLATPLAAQVAPPADPGTTGLPRWSAGLAAELGRPTGDFRQNVNNAGGAQGHLRVRLDQNGIVSLRLQAGWLNYGNETKRTCLASTPGCRVDVRVNTVNGILFAGVGPEIAYQMGILRAYAHGLVGTSRFATVSAIDGGLLPDFVAGDENFGDSGFAWSTGAGMQFPLSRRVALDLGVDFQGHGEREYLLKGGLTDNSDGSLVFAPKRSAANLFAVRLGMTTSLGWRKGKPNP
jgi:opacity protein-like surface antigen